VDRDRSARTEAPKGLDFGAESAPEARLSGFEGSGPVSGGGPPADLKFETRRLFPRFRPASSALQTPGQWSRPPAALSLGVRPNSPVATTIVESRRPRAPRSSRSATGQMLADPNSGNAGGDRAEGAPDLPRCIGLGVPRLELARSAHQHEQEDRAVPASNSPVQSGSRLVPVGFPGARGVTARRWLERNPGVIPVLSIL
jgi:hypothetical protein